MGGLSLEGAPDIKLVGEVSRTNWRVCLLAGSLWYDAYASNLEVGVYTNVCPASACFNNILYPDQSTPALRR
jgi:hypothetical protein